MTTWASIEGQPHPLGVSRLDAEGAYNFALFSRHATSVTLLLFHAGDTSRPILERELDPRRNKTGPIWHCRLPTTALEGVDLYAYRIEGPPAAGRYESHQFDPEKVLFDPYAKGIVFPDAFDRPSAMKPGPTLGKAPLGQIDVELCSFDWGGDRRPRHEGDLVIYEMHVKGFTRDPSSGVSEDRRGTYAGVIEKIPHLVRLGVTAVELLPVFQFDPQEKNYWGYMPISFFAPHSQYATRPHTQVVVDEFREMVRALHAADIEVILDVVYNHTGEGNLDGPTYNLKGIDNSTYYIGSGNPENPYFNFSGTGNAMNCSKAATRQLILDSMRYWVSEMHVDGFRFDLASVLSRDLHGGVPAGPPIFGAIAQDPTLRGVRLIAEPWDAAGLYQLGFGFPGRSWMQWNDRFRDDIRRFVKGDPGFVGALMARLYGSSDVFPDDVYHTFRPWQSVHYITSHDGFTLYDLVSYNRKHNEANGYQGTDGHEPNHSWNCGIEGDEALTSSVLELRKRQAKNLLTLLFLANGTPMIMAGDEFLHTQGGNNNPFNQDNETTWIDWSRAEEHADNLRFVQKLIAFRKAHRTIARSTFWRDDISWYGVGEHVDMTWHSRSLAYCLRGDAVDDRDLYVMINAYEKPLDFEVQEGTPGTWSVAIDTGLRSPDDIADVGSERPLGSRRCRVAARSIVVLVGGGR